MYNSDYLKLERGRDFSMTDKALLYGILKPCLVVMAFIVFSSFSHAERLGVALVCPQKSTECIENNSTCVLSFEKVQEILEENFVPYIVIDDKDIAENALEFFEIALVLSPCSPLSLTEQKLTNFEDNGGKLIATYDLSNSLEDNNQETCSNYLAENIARMLKASAPTFSLPLDDLNRLSEDFNKRYKSCMKIYQKFVTENNNTDEIRTLYESATLNHKALEFALKKEAPYHGTYYLSHLRVSLDKLFPLIHPLHKPYKEIIDRRGDYWLGKVDKFYLEKVVDNAFIFVGDSITEGYYLQGYLANVPTINRGISMDTANGVLERCSLLNLETNPQAVLLMIGTNNLLYDLYLDSYFQDVEEILLYIKQKAPNTKIYLQSILPLGKDKAAAPKVKEYNKKLQTIAKKLEIEFLDVYSLMAQDDCMPKSLSEDGIHPNGTSYQIWADLLLEQFKKDKLI